METVLGEPQVEKTTGVSEKSSIANVKQTVLENKLLTVPILSWLIPQLVVRYRLLKRLFFRSLRATVFLFFRLWLHRIVNPEKLPTSGPVMIASNHLSHFDWAVLGSVLRKQTVFLAANELKQHRAVKWLARFNTLIYVDRDQPGIKCFREIIRQFKAGKIVVVYPEGSRSRTGKRQPAKRGFVKLAMLAKIPVVPIAMRGTYKILSPFRKVPRLHRCEIAVGDPIFLTASHPRFRDLYPFLDPHSKTGPILQEMAERIMDEIANIADPEWDNPVLRNRDPESENHSRIKRYGDRIAAFFDVDKTIVPFHTQRLFAVFCYRRNILPLRETLLAHLWYPMSKLGFLKDSRAYRHPIYRFFTTYSLQEWDLLFDEFMQTTVYPRISNYVLEIVRTHLRQKHYVILISATIDQIAERLKVHLGAHFAIATKLETDGNRYTGRIRGPIIDGFNKALLAEKFAQTSGVDLTKSYVYADSFRDLRLLSKVGQPIAVNPDPRLAFFAKRKKWPILHIN